MFGIVEVWSADPVPLTALIAEAGMPPRGACQVTGEDAQSIAGIRNETIHVVREH
jgi:hypothetical protein